jgi:Tfp pilus assembly PilM family ATPase
VTDQRESFSERIAARLKSLAYAIAWQEFDGPTSALPKENGAEGPLGNVGRVFGLKTAAATRTIKRSAGAQLGELTSIAINDRSLRVLVTRGNRVLHWSTADLPPGIVDDGSVINGRRFAAALRAVVISLHEGSRMERRKAAVIVSGRNTVQGRFVLLDTGDESMESSVLALAAERMSVTPSDVQLDWDAQPLEPIEGEDDDQISARPAVDDDEDDGEPFEVYALGIFKNVLETNLRPIKQAGMKTAAVAPKALALAASVAVESAIVVDIELDTLSVVVVKDGLPEVVRDMRSSADLNEDQWGRALSAHIERSVEFHDMLNPQETIGPETPVFVTGRSADARRATLALKARRYNVVDIPDVLDAPHGFPMDEMAANVGMAVMRGRKPWQRSSAPVVDRPHLRFVPPAYEPRALPLKPIAATAAAAVFAAGLVSGYGQVSDVRGQADGVRAELTTLDRRIDLQSDRIRQLVRDQALVSVVRADAEAVLSASEAIRDPDGGFSKTLDVITASAPDGVSIEEVDDDGHLVTLRASARNYDLLLDFTRVLEGSAGTQAGIQGVRVTSIGSPSSSLGPGGSMTFAEEDLFGLLPGFDFGSETGSEAAPDLAVSMSILELELTR